MVHCSMLQARIVVKNDSINLDSLRVSSYLEGPHVQWQSHDWVEVFYIKHDSLKNKTRKLKRSYQFSKDTLVFREFALNKKKRHRIPRSFTPPKARFNASDKIVVIGDIHGEYDSLVELLTYNGIMSKDHNWTWGKGHLVFTGDIFDRGDRVTECLWLIYSLEQQALKHGGYVHYLLGNHELMTLLYDHRYVHHKYLHASHFLKTHPSNLFSRNTILGNWLLSKNSIIKIGDLLFVHGGIDPTILQKKITMDSINAGMRYYLRHFIELTDTTVMDLYFYTHSPAWYRGYLSSTPYYKRITIEQIYQTLKYFEASSIIFGHTPVSRIYPLLNYKLIAVDVPIGHESYEDQGLLIEDKKYFRIFTNKKKQPL